MSRFLLNHSQIAQVEEQTAYYIALANQHLHLNLSKIKIDFDLKGRTSGMFVVTANLVRIRYNQIIFSQYFEDALVNTVAHEAAHYVVYSIWGIKKVKPHGKEWQQVMALFGVKAEVTSNYDVKDLPLHRQKQFEYSCGCMNHQLSTTRHNKVLKKKAVYKCRKCSQALNML